MSKRELANLAEEFVFDGARKRAKNEEDADEELRCFSFSANEMYNKMKGLDASSPPTFIPYTAEQTLLEGKICDMRKKRSDKKRRIITVSWRPSTPNCLSLCRRRQKSIIWCRSCNVV